MGRPSPDASTKTWAIWLSATVTTFAALEAHAVHTRRQPTLSHCLRVWLGVQPERRHGQLAVLAFCGFWCWLCGHLALGWGPNLNDTSRPT